MKTRTAFVTGANSGIGLAITEELLQNGHRVIAHYNSDRSNLAKITNDKLHPIQCNFSKPELIEDMLLNKIFKEFPVDILINNAGTYLKTSNFESIPMDEFDEVLQVNLKAPLILTQKLLPHMKEQKWGRVINISSCNLKHGGNPATVHYTISKGSLEILSKAVAKEGAPFNILSNSVRVGFVETKFHSLNEGKDLQERAKFLMLKRAGQPIEIANVIKFLCGNESSFITGTTIEVDGGE